LRSGRSHLGVPGGGRNSPEQAAPHQTGVAAHSSFGMAKATLDRGTKPGFIAMNAALKARAENSPTQ